MNSREAAPLESHHAGWGRATSPYHAGEMAVQESAGARDFAERVGRKVIRDHMPDQHREFFATLPYVFMGSLDNRRRPWASVLSGEPGFLHSPDPRSLVVSALPLGTDPARAGLQPGAPLAFVGVELHTRRRNRLTGKIRQLNPDGFVFTVDQSFGNCPQYIQARAPTPGALAPGQQQTCSLGPLLDERSSAIISRADTFFIASASLAAGTDDPVEGVDVNHRGGRPGFVRVETISGRSVITAPDFVGNLAFNTLGNIELNPLAGLLFPDFDTGDLVTLTGRAEIIWDGPELSDFAGAERLLRIFVDEAYYIPGVLPWRWTPPQEARQLSATGDWQAVERARRARTDARLDRPFRIVRIEQESPSVRSFYLQPTDGLGLVSYEPGQFLPVAVAPIGAAKLVRRTYSLSQEACDGHYRISIRLDPRDPKAAIQVSNWFHRATIGTEILVQSPRGSFHLDRDSSRSVVLIAGGVGITPLLAMAEYLSGGSDSRQRFPDRPVRLIHAVKNGADHPFRGRLSELAQTRGNFSALFAYSAPRAEDRLGEDYQVAGRLNRAALRAHIPLDDHDYYLCGPAGFMHTVYEALRSLGVADARIHDEAFGPATLRRIPDGPAAAEAPPIVDPVEAALVSFAASRKTASWQTGKTLLELAEDCGVEADWSCRMGRCGTCQTAVLNGRVTYATPPEFPLEPGTALICRASPADAAVTIDL